jgi:chemotaxis family two-component system sensor kinase Cph1
MADTRPPFGAAHGAAVQPRGALLVIDLDTFVVIEASNNVFDILAITVNEILGTPIESLVGAEAAASFRHILDADGTVVNPTAVQVNERAFDAIVHRSASAGIVEFEPCLAASSSPSSASVYGAFHRLASATDSTMLWENAVREITTITGFDRVMIYQFSADGHGQVVADAHAAGMESYLGMRYPTSDIPDQTRELYRTVLSRTIVDLEQTAAAMVTLPGTPSATDLGHAGLRTASAHHMQFMRALGQASTLSFSLIHNGELVGIITCVHRTPRWLPYSLRQGLEILANQLALHVSSMNTIESLSRLVRVRSTRAGLLAQAQASDDIAQSLVAGRLTLLDLIPADAAAISLGGVTTSIGAVPSYLELSAVVDYLRSAGHTTAVVTDHLAQEHPALAKIVPDVAGFIMVPLGGAGLSEGNFLAWFRRETIHNVCWLGNQSASNRVAAQSPTESTSWWSESIFGRSLPWDGLDSEAGELGRDLDRAMLVRVESKLADLALRDGLTGLPNRRLFMDRLEHALTKYARGEELAVLFIDLDGVKAANDAAGHNAGDAVIRHAGQLIEASIRTQDTVARVGGDEFIVMCENTTGEEGLIVANRILAALSRAVMAESQLPVTASIGLATARFNFSALDLLNEANAAMSRAKARGKNAVSQ